MMSRATTPPQQPTPEPHQPDASSCSRASGPARPQPRGAVCVRLEGAPWLSLRDRCGAPSGHYPASRKASRRSRWLSLSRLEVAMVLVLCVLLSAVFQGARHDPLLALSAPESMSEAPPIATVSLSE